MAQPTPYTRQFDFTDFSTDHPSASQQPGTALDAEYTAIKETIDEILHNLALIQKDDTTLANQSVGRSQLKTEVVAGINTPVAWSNPTAYTVRDSVIQGTAWYWCLVSHTSTASFANDLAGGKWQLIFDFAGLGLAASIADHSLGYVKIQNVTATDKVLGRFSSGAGTIEEITFTSAARALADDTSVGAMLTTLGVSAYGQTLIDDTSAGAAQTTLGISTFMKTLIDDTSAGAAQLTLGLGDMATFYAAAFTPAYFSMNTVGEMQIVAGTNASVIGSNTLTLSAGDDVTVYAEDVLQLIGENILISGDGAGQSLDIDISGPMTVDLGSATNFMTIANPIRTTASRMQNSSDFTKAANTTLAAITGMSASIKAGISYDVDIMLFITADATGGAKVGVTIGGAAGSFRGQVQIYANSTDALVLSSSLTGTGSAGGVAGDTDYYVRITGNISATTDATFSATFAQNVSSGSSSVKAGSIMKINPI